MRQRSSEVAQTIEEHIDLYERFVEERTLRLARRGRLHWWDNRTGWFIGLLALSLVLSYVWVLQMPEGGEITFFSMLIVCLIGYILGPKEGLFGAFLFGALKYGIDYVLTGRVFDPALEQLCIAELCDFLLGYTLLGVCGVLCSPSRRVTGALKSRSVRVYSLPAAFVIAVLLRFAESVVNYLVFYPRPDLTALQALWDAVVYCVNYVLLEGALSFIALCVPQVMEAVLFLWIVAHRSYEESYDYY